MINAIQIAVSGLNAASRRADTAASNIANAATTSIPEPAGDAGSTGSAPANRPYISDTDLITDIMNLKMASTTYKANAKVIDVATDMQDSLLSVFDRDV